MQTTSISWTDFTSNPLKAVDAESGKEGWICSKLSEGCTNCYAESINLRYGNKLLYNAPSIQKVKWVLKEKEIAAWYRLKEPSKIFICDMTDLFHESIPAEFRNKI